MRLGRPLAAASAVAAMTGASLIASPALANDSNRNSTSSPTSSSSPSPSENAPSPSSSSESHSSSSFRITQEKTFVSASTNSSFTVSGTGCTGQQATVGIALYAPDGTVSDIVKTEAAADGSWSTDLDLAALIKSIGSSTATTTDGWTIGAGCMTYGGKTETVQTTTQQQTQIFFDDTRISGSYEVSARTETQSQTFTFNAQGFYAGETVTVLLKHKSDSSIRYTLGELTVDANGNLVGNLPAPTDAADGEYLLVLTGSHHGETATSKTITTVSNHTFTIKNSERSTSENETTENNGGGGETQTNGDSSKTTERSTSEHETTENNGGGGETQTNGGGEDKTTTDQQVNNQTNRSKSVSSGTKESSSDTRAAGETNTNNGKSLAHTGANGLIFGGIAALLVAIGGAVLFLRRRNKA
ncbi:LPXTG cell wall anchor domain-containing protein [Actinomyces johnsonii]|nr:LPXTG cell wall anchor domain-containing protein [Actinomyces johnsonii]